MDTFFECRDDMEPTNHPVGGHNLEDVLVGFNLEERLQKEGVPIPSVLLAIWLHKNGKLFKGRVASINCVAYAVESFVETWSSWPGGGEGA